MPSVILICPKEARCLLGQLALQKALCLAGQLTLWSAFKYEILMHYKQIRVHCEKFECLVKKSEYSICVLNLLVTIMLL